LQSKKLSLPKFYRGCLDSSYGPGFWFDMAMNHETSAAELLVLLSSVSADAPSSYAHDNLRRQTKNQHACLTHLPSHFPSFATFHLFPVLSLNHVPSVFFTKLIPGRLLSFIRRVFSDRHKVAVAIPLTLVPATVFCDVCRQVQGVFYPQSYLEF